MKYIEEISPGDCFLYQEHSYFLSSDFKNNGQRLAYSMTNGFPKWFKNNDIVDIMPVYRLDDNSNIIPLKETKKDEHNFSKDTNIY